MLSGFLMFKFSRENVQKSPELLAVAITQPTILFLLFAC